MYFGPVRGLAVRFGPTWTRQIQRNRTANVFFFFIFIILKPLKQTPGVSDPKKWGNNLDRMIFLGAMLRGLELHLLCCSYTCVYMCRIRREYTVDLRPPPRAPHESPQRFCSRHPLPNNALVWGLLRLLTSPGSSTQLEEERDCFSLADVRWESLLLDGRLRHWRNRPRPLRFRLLNPAQEGSQWGHLRGLPCWRCRPPQVMVGFPSFTVLFGAFLGQFRLFFVGSMHY